MGIEERFEDFQVSELVPRSVRVNYENRIIEWLLARCNYAAIAQPAGKNPFPEGPGREQPCCGALSATFLLRGAI